MEEKKGFSVKMGGKKQRNQQQQAKEEMVGEGSYTLYDEEAAATVEKDVPVLDQLNKKPSDKNKLTMSPIAKKLTAAALGAALIGVVLGFLLLRYTAGIESETSGVAAPVATKEAAVNAGAFGDLTAYVVQGGVYNQEDIGQEVAQRYVEAGIPAVLWEKNGQFFLLTGMGGSKEEADAAAAQLQAQGYESYVKTWDPGVEATSNGWQDELAVLLAAGDNQEPALWKAWQEKVPAEAAEVKAASTEAISAMEQGTFTASMMLPVWHEAAKLTTEAIPN
ncbi:SPOR domain-containing protein [Terribacillus halophilus]|jgi:stage II sporulation protein B|uniref:SPOR domain-containing protein n=1 Tax=Terribacillus halophilus TaxID=361279 RepID=UPI000987A473|nr:SPOR domain-containing protein [Terribacillus halophilus]